MIVSTILIPTAAFGLCRLIGLAASLVSDPRSRAVRCAGWALSLSALALVQLNAILSPINDGLGGYREAGHWLTERIAEGGKVVDVTGWAQFYSGRAGYTFEDLIAASADPTARWVVVREAHLKGPWDYCGRLRSLVEGHSPVIEFQGQTGSKPTRVLVFDRFLGQTALGTKVESPLRR